MLRFEEPLSKTLAYSVIGLPLDSDYFGFPCAKATLEGRISENELAEILEVIRGYRLITFYNVGNDWHNNSLLQRYNMFIQTDINIQLTRPVALDASPIRQDIQLRNNCPRDEILLGIANRVFKHSRFFNDPNVNCEKSTNFYRWWLNLSFEREDKYVITAKADEPEGFLLFRHAEDAIVIELIGVLPSSSGKGTGTAMIALLNQYAAENGCIILRTGTQLENMPALRFYQKNGFFLTSSSSIYHLWQK